MPTDFHGNVGSTCNPGQRAGLSGVCVACFTYILYTNVKKNDHVQKNRLEASGSRFLWVSTMGRSKGSEHICGTSRKMRQRLTVMSEETGTEPLPGLKQDPASDAIPTVPLIDRFEDVEALKCRVQKVALKNDANGEGQWENDNAYPPTTSESGRESTLSLSSDDTLNCDDYKCESSDVPASSELECADHTTSHLTVTSQRHHERTNSDTSIKAGLLMSPVLLTEDVPVDVGASNRLSSVLENISLPLLYLPTTKQIVNGEKSTGLTHNSVHADTSPCANALSANGSDSNIYQGAGNEALSSPMFSMGSGSGCEVDRLRPEPDRVTLNSVESFTSNTLCTDPTARLYDTSSLSSISTGTDFSVSAVSVGDDHGDSKFVMCDGEEGFIEVNLHGRNSYETSKNSSLDSGFEDRGAKPKKKGFSGFLSR